jgi:hypothetical protein
MTLGSQSGESSVELWIRCCRIERQTTFDLARSVAEGVVLAKQDGQKGVGGPVVDFQQILADGVKGCVLLV